MVIIIVIIIYCYYYYHYYYAFVWINILSQRLFLGIGVALKPLVSDLSTLNIVDVTEVPRPWLL